MKGLVTYFNEEKGWGRIYGEDGRDYHAHFSKIIGRASKILWERETVFFDSIPPRHEGQLMQAISIRPEDTKATDQISIYRNPFDPYNPINNPQKFAGRKRYIHEAASALVNNNNILITGERGIGKSSLANQMVYIAEGDNYLLDKTGIKLEEVKNLDYAAISIRGHKNMSIMEMAGNIIREYVKKYDLDEKKQIEHEIDLKIYKSKIKNIITNKGYDNLLDLFNYDIIKIHDILNRKSGLLVLIDEIENFNHSVNFAGFIKNINEYFVTERKRITFIISGIQCSITDLFLQHPSFLRLFKPIELKELSPIESYELLDIFMSEQRKRITSYAKSRISQIATGLPVNLQLLGYYSYQIDSNNNITKEDLNVAIDFIISKVKKEEFITRHESIGFGLPEKILRHTISYNPNDTIIFEKLVKIFHEYNEEDLLDAIELLLSKELILRLRKGEYYIKDQLFYLYLKRHYS